jgi:hypothetical protein
MYCPKCQTHNPDQSPSCRSCGYTFGVASVRPGRDPKKLLVSLVIVIVALGVIGGGVIVSVVGKVAKSLLNASDVRGPTIDTMSSAYGTSYTLSDMGEINISYPESGIANSNDSEVAAFTYPVKESSTPSDLHIWSPSSEIPTSYPIDLPNLMLMDINDRDEAIIEGTVSMVRWSPNRGGDGKYMSLLAFDGTTKSYAGDINDSGLVSGGAQIRKDVYRPCEWSERSANPISINTGLHAEFPFEIASVLNDNGDVAIWAMKPSGDGFLSDSYLFKDGRLTAVTGLPGLTNTIPMAVNNKDEIAGNMFASTTAIGADPHEDRAFIWRNSKLSDIGTIGTRYAEAISMNNLSQVVGTCYDKPIDVNANAWELDNSRAFLWQGAKMTDLNTLLPPGSPWLLEEATQINDKGQIVGIGSYAGHESHGFVLTPQ